jgi:hypothetical protein
MRLRWPPCRRRRVQGCEDIDAAIWEANRALQDAKQLRCRADGIGEALRETRRLNHFGEAVARAIRGV